MNVSRRWLEAFLRRPLDAADVHDVLSQLRVFRRSASDPETAAHRQMLRHLRDTGELLPETAAWLQQVRDEGYDWLLVVEELRDGPVDGQGVNDRWPLTLATWLMLGLGIIIAVVFMDQGRIVEDATKDDFFGKPRSERAQQFLAKILHH